LNKLVAFSVILSVFMNTAAKRRFSYHFFYFSYQSCFL